MQLGSEETIGRTWHQPRSLLADCLVQGVASASVFAEVSGRTQPWKTGGGAGLPPVCPSGAPCRTQRGARAVPAPGHRVHSDLHHLHSSFRSREAARAGLMLHGPVRGVGLRCQKGGAAPAPCVCAVLRGAASSCAAGRGREGMQISAAAAGKPGAVCRRQLRANPVPFLLPFFQTEIAKRLNTILAQIMPFLSQEVRTFPCPGWGLCFPREPSPTRAAFWGAGVALGEAGLSPPWVL